jgi:hypothetical protein
MPPDDRFGLDDYQGILPARPGRPQHRPEEPIQRVQGRSGPLAFQHRHLVAKGENFHSDVHAAMEEDADGGDQGEDEVSTDWF